MAVRPITDEPDYTLCREGHPDVEEYRVVVAGVAAAIVARGAVEHRVRDVLQTDLQIDEWPRPPTPGKVIQVPGTSYRGAVR